MFAVHCLTVYEPLISENSLHALFSQGIRQSSVGCVDVKANYDVDERLIVSRIFP